MLVNLQEPRKRVGVIASSGDARLQAGHERTLAALESVFPVRFVAADPAEPELDGVLVLGAGDPAGVPDGCPRLVLALDARQPGSRVGVAAAPGTSRSVVLAQDASLARPLRGRALPDSCLAGELEPPGAAGRVLARVDGGPVWQTLGEDSSVSAASSYPLARLDEGEALRDHLRAGRFMQLLPLVHFLGHVLGPTGWSLPPLRASFVIDDPNLHWPSYGFINYPELVAHAVRHSYHVGLATVPLDGWRADRRVTSLLSQNASVLSLSMHGNDHVSRELGRLNTDDAALPSIAQALRRVASLERRSGLSVDRVMAPPHGSCSEASLRAMFTLGMDAACNSRPYPWRNGLPAPTPLADWYPAELVAGGLPVLPRHPLNAPREDLALRAMLGQPIILYGHHGDFADGLELLAQATRDVNSLGDARWCSLGAIARTSYATRVVADTLLVRMHSRRIALEVPAGVRALRVLVHAPSAEPGGHAVTHDGGRLELAFDGRCGISQALSVEAPCRIGLTLAADRALTPGEVRSPSVRLWPLLRRALVEGRDRVQALVGG